MTLHLALAPYTRFKVRRVQRTYIFRYVHLASSSPPEIDIRTNSQIP